MVILMPHATPKATGVEGQAALKEESFPLKGLKPWNVQPAIPSASIKGLFFACLCGAFSQEGCVRVKLLYEVSYTEHVTM